MSIKGKDLGIILGSAGAIFGGLLWIIITGIVIKSALYIILPSIIAVAGILIVIKLYYMYPEKWLVILGSLLLLLVIINAVFLNLLYPKIPDFIGEISTGKNQMALLQINIFLAIFSFWGLFCIFVGIFKKKKS
ncbi:MAG: hypothetical protein FJW61_03720 [Actinobacteria bacterium]|nr:hypothetical protein [Actinomycetota bacterium]MBM3714076.1 hypothetical protein [Actinomycetota bacterium]